MRQDIRARRDHLLWLDCRDASTEHVPLDGARVIVRDVSLAITEGTGMYAGLLEGTGSLDATSDPESAPQFVATLGLSF